MSIYTNEGLVKHAENALKLNTKYMWGGILREITHNYIDLLRSMYGNNPATGYTVARWNELKALVGQNFYGVDCVGLIKSYYWSGNANGGTGSPKYGATGFPDVNAGTMYQQAKEKGPISTMPDIPGIIVYSKSHPHVGIYIGNGETIESTLGSRGDGVVKRRLDSLWEYWFKCPFIEYLKPPTIITTKLDFAAKIRRTPSVKSPTLGRFEAETVVKYIKDSDTVDATTKSTYVQLADKTGWIVKSALHNGG